MRLRRSGSVSMMLGLLAASILAVSVFGQSSDSNFPTPLTSNVINSTIKPRDIGDPRLTTQYYAFGGDQGDIFINVVAKNFDGDIDVFAAEGMRPLTKMVIYSDSGMSETGRLIYLRKAERLLIRIEGRPPDDRPATVQVKFGGSFVAMKGRPALDTEVPTVTNSEQGNVRVNSVGTIIEELENAKPEAKTKPAETIAEIPKTDSTKPAGTKKQTVVVTDNTAPAVRDSKPGKPKENVKKPAAAAANTDEAKLPPIRPVKKPKSKETAGTERDAPAEKPKADPLADIRLVIAFKNGDRLERPLSEVLRFSVDKGVLTVIAKDGGIRRYLMVDVAEVTIK